MGPAIDGPFSEVVGLGNTISMVNRMGNRYGTNKVADIGEWSICGGGRLERFYCKDTDAGLWPTFGYRPTSQYTSLPSLLVLISYNI